MLDGLLVEHVVHSHSFFKCSEAMTERPLPAPLLEPAVGHNICVISHFGADVLTTGIILLVLPVFAS